MPTLTATTRPSLAGRPLRSEVTGLGVEVRVGEGLAAPGSALGADWPLPHAATIMAPAQAATVSEVRDRVTWGR